MMLLRPESLHVGVGELERFVGVGGGLLLLPPPPRPLSVLHSGLSGWRLTRSWKWFSAHGMLGWHCSVASAMVCGISQVKFMLIISRVTMSGRPPVGTPCHRPTSTSLPLCSRMSRAALIASSPLRASFVLIIDPLRQLQQRLLEPFLVGVVGLKVE